MKLSNNDVILFSGDSITDCGRDRSDFYSLSGYNQMIMQQIDKTKNLQIKACNRGIGGDTSTNLLARLQNDILEVKPTVISILIGINDTWRRYDSNMPTSIQKFESNIRGIMDISKKHVERIILLEPFLISSNPETSCFREDLDPKINMLRKLAVEYKTYYIPLDGIFAELSIMENPQKFSQDSVHPTVEGNKVIAKQWLQRIM